MGVSGGVWGHSWGRGVGLGVWGRGCGVGAGIRVGREDQIWAVGWGRGKGWGCVGGVCAGGDGGRAANVTETRSGRRDSHTENSASNKSRPPPPLPSPRRSSAPRRKLTPTLTTKTNIVPKRSLLGKTHHIEGVLKAIRQKPSKSLSRGPLFPDLVPSFSSHRHRRHRGVLHFPPPYPPPIPSLDPRLRSGNAVIRTTACG